MWGCVKFKEIKCSEGSAPSVQKIREVLGTGSNTTIAEHLKVWRAEYANQEIHHLPASMPKELVSAMEALWQTAIEHASNQLATIKAELTAQQEKIQQEKIITEKTIADLTHTLADKEQKLVVHIKEIQTLEKQLAVEQERVSKEKETQSTLIKQHELRLQHAMGEKHRTSIKSITCRIELPHWSSSKQARLKSIRRN